MSLQMWFKDLPEDGRKLACPFPSPPPLHRHTLINMRHVEEFCYSMNYLRGERRIVLDPGSCPDTEQNSAAPAGTARMLSKRYLRHRCKASQNARASRPQLLHEIIASRSASASKPPLHRSEVQQEQTKLAQLQIDWHEAGRLPPTARKKNRCAYF